MASLLGWLAAAAVSAYACRLVAHFPTPIDAALPLLAVIVTAVAWAGRAEGMAAVPLLMLAEIAIADERARLAAFGVIVAGAFVMTLLGHPERERGAWAARRLASAYNLTTVCAIVVLRWIPFSEVMIGRELLLIAFALAIVAVMRASAFAVAVAVLVALVTPAVPLRTFWLPLAVLAAMVLFRFFGMPRLRADLLGTCAVAAMLVFFAWSGVAARALPYLLHDVRRNAIREPVGAALLRGESITIDVPPYARALVLSGANVPQLDEGALVGRIEPGPRAIRIGDLADWGYLRREQHHAARNVLPRDPAGELHGYGYTAWVDGRGRVPLPEGVRQIRITAAEGLPEGARLQVDFLETFGK